MAEEEPWKLVEDGCVNLRCESDRIVHHPILNVVIVFMKSFEVLVVDVNTGSVLHKSHAFAMPGSQVLCEYLEGSRKILFSDGKSIGIRSDYNGIVLLDSILQPPVTKTEDLVKVELLWSEAVLLLKTFSCLKIIGVKHVGEVTQELNQKIEDSHLDLKKGNKIQKWNTICMELPHFVLKSVFGALVQELKRQNKQTLALPVASAINERLNRLLPSSIANTSTDRALMCSEAARRETFVSWPHMDYKWALPDEMAEAGFYHQPNSVGDDRAMCFTCSICLVCWEPADQPWEEHLRHSSNCPFVKGEYTQNVPLSVTYATSPAVSIDNPEETVDFISTSSVPDVIATASHQGYVVLWNVLKDLKKEICFYIDIPTSVLAKFMQRVDSHVIQTDTHRTPHDHVFYAAGHVTRSKNSLKRDLTAVSVVGAPQYWTTSVLSTNKSNHTLRTTIRPCIVGGVSITPGVLQSMQTDPEPRRTTQIDSSSIVETVNNLISEICREASNRTFTGFTELDPHVIVNSPVVQCRKLLCLVVYDYNFRCHSDNLVSSSTKVVWGTFTNTPVEEKHKAQEHLYEPLEEGEIPTFESPGDLIQGLEFPSSSPGVFYSSAEGTAENNSGSYDDISLKYSPGTEEVVTSHITSEGSPASIEVPCETGKINDPSDINTVESDHSLKSTNRSTPKQLKCIVLPDQFNQEDLYISGIYPTKDGNHLLVVVEVVRYDGNISQESNSSIADTYSSNEFAEWTDSSDMETDNEGQSFNICLYSETLPSGFIESLPESPSLLSNSDRSVDTSKISDKDNVKSTVIGINYGGILVYSLNSENDVITVNDVPVKVKEFSSGEECPSEVLILPHSDRDDMTVPSSLLDLGARYPLGLAVLICRSGVAKILDIATLKVLSTAVPEKKGMKFVSAAYCNNMERLCLCSNRGSLHFFVMNYRKGYGSTIDGNGIVVPSSDLIQIQCSRNDPDSLRRDTITSSDNLMISQSALGISELSSLLDLTKYENIIPVYSATVPACWIETMHAHKRSNLFLQQMEDSQHSRSWRLQTDVTSWCEHTFELTVPRNYCVGHVELKFSFRSPCIEYPGIEVTLLRMNSCAIGKKDVSIPSDNESVEFPTDVSYEVPSEDSTNNLVSSAGPLQQLNAEILCGPVNLATCLDLTELGGTVTLTSPKLHRNRGRTLLVHMKAISASTDQVNFSQGSCLAACKSSPRGLYQSLNVVFQPPETYDSVPKLAVWAVRKRFGCLEHFVGLVQALPGGMTGQILHQNKFSEPFLITHGLKKGCVLAPTLFALYLVAVLYETADNPGVEIKYCFDGGLFNFARLHSRKHTSVTRVTEMQYADDTTSLALTPVELQGNKVHHGKASKPKKRKVEHSGQNIVDRMMFYLSKKDYSESTKSDIIKGCDWLHEVSITLYKTKQSSVTNERNQRCAMLETDSFVKKLLEVVVLAGSNKTIVAQSMALDILNWVASVRLGRRRTSQGDTESDQLAFVQIIQDDLCLLIKNCIILAGRSIAQKCVKLIVICREGMKNYFDSSTVAFDGYVLKAALQCLPYILHCQSAGAMRWYFLLLSHVLTVDGSSDAGLECVSLLQQVAHEMNSRWNPYLMILNTRFGIYKTPLELDLFDAEAPPPMKSSSIPVTYAEVGGGDGISGVGVNVASSSPASAATSTPIDLREILGLTAIGVDIPNDAASKSTQFGQFSSKFYLKGLLEVMPLHFKCHASSDGSKMERIEAGIFTDGMPAEEPVSVDSFPQTNTAVAPVFGQNKTDNDSVSSHEEEKKESPIVSKNDGITAEIYQGKTLGAGKKVASSEQAKDDLTYEVKSVYSQHDNEGDIEESSVDATGSTSFDASGSDQYTCDSVPHQSDATKKVADSITVLPWQELLSLPPQYELVVESMHSAARRFVILDFGREILLTDVIIPSCPELAALFIDTWCKSEKIDGRRLIISSDIGSKPLVMSDIQPPPVCRYLKITAVGRLGMTTTKCKIPLGSFYGHVLILPGEENLDSARITSTSLKNIEAQLHALRVLYDDILCRYNCSRNKLKELLTPYLTSEMPNMQHVYNYLRRERGSGNLGSREVMILVTLAPGANCRVWLREGAQRVDGASHVFNAETKQPDDMTVNVPHQHETKSKALNSHSKLHGTVNCPERMFSVEQNRAEAQMMSQEMEAAMARTQPECSGFQRKLNLIHNIVRRLETAHRKEPFLPDVQNIQTSLAQASTDKLRVLTNCLLDILLHIAYELGPVQMLPVSLYKKFDQGVCEALFSSLCMREEAYVQLATCVLLVRMCGLQPWWGDFLAGVFSHFYSSQNMIIFPQDRVFTLLTYMGRKALRSGASFRVLINSILLLLKELISPISGRDMNIFKVKIDTNQIEWVLLFLSVCLDLNGNTGFWTCMEEGINLIFSAFYAVSSSRWDFMHGEIAIQKLAAVIQNAKKNIRHHLKERMLNEKLEEAKDNVAQPLRRNRRREAKHFFRARQRNYRVPGDSVVETDLRCFLSQSYVLPVAKGLIEFILKMDFTSSIDVLLLACKVLANIVANTCPAITLSQLMTEQQLLHMVRLAVWNDYSKVARGGPWAFQAICVLLGEIIEAEKLHEKKVKVNMQGTIDQNSSVEDRNNVEHQLLCTDGQISSSHGLDNIVDAVSSGGYMKVIYCNSLFESDDSDGDGEDSDEALDVKKAESKQDPTCQPSVSTTSVISTALDYRLECGVEVGVNVALRNILTRGACRLSVSLNSPILPPPDDVKQVSSPSQEFETCRHHTSENALSETVQMLTKVFETLFVELYIPNSWTNLELILQLWLTLNKIIDSNTEIVAGFYTSMGSCIYLSPAAVSGVIGALTFLPGISLRAWCLGFYCLTSIANLPFADVATPGTTSSWTPETVEDIENSLVGMAKIIIGDMQFLPMLLRFLSGSGVHGMQSSNVNVGPRLCQSLHNLLLSLQMRCDVVTTNSRFGNFLKERFLKLVYQLIQPSGAIACQQGPLDVQCEFIDMLIHLNYFGVDLSTVTSIVECTGNLIYNYVLTTEDVHCRRGPESGVNGSVCFSRFRKTQITSGSSTRQHISWNYLMCSLLKLCSRLIQTPLNNHVNVGRRYPDRCESRERASGQVGSLAQPGSSGSCQTDEHKVAEQQISGDGNLHQGFVRAEIKIPCVADTVLQHMPTVIRLLMALAGCRTTEVALVMGSAAAAEQNFTEALGDIYEPATVGDGLFQLLLTLSQKASSPELILKPLFSFLSTASSSPPVGTVGVTQLSEPLIWFVVRVLNSSVALEAFNRMGGIKVLCENLVRSNRLLISTHPGLVSTLINHFSIVPQHLALHHLKGGASPEFIDGLMNFAPLGLIEASSPSAPCPDVLIHTTPPHRRARTPAWTYHFYESERWMHLKVTLPCAVLLKEIHLHPHLTSLATCPSAVAVEVLRDGDSTFVPLCGSVPTSGLTFIRLQFQPEVVVSILLRLHKPSDSNSIGLTQLKLLGSTTFGETFSKLSTEVPQEDSYSRSGLGWLRLLHHCIHFPESKSELAVSQYLSIAAAAEVEGLLESCLEMLLISAPSGREFVPKLEFLLLKLGHHSDDLGNKEIDLLLHRAPAIFLQGAWPVGKPDVYSSPAVDAVAHILFELCTAQGEAVGDRITNLLSWLHDKAACVSQCTSPRVSLWYPPAAVIHCISSILWWGKECGLDCDLPDLITTELFSNLYVWTGMLPTQSMLKRAIDRVLCSMCHIKPECFPAMLKRMGVLVTKTTHQNASVSDDRKDHDPQQLLASISDDSKELVVGGDQGTGKEWYELLVIQDLHQLELNENQLMTIASVCQSKEAVQILLDSGLPALLTQCVAEFCQKEQLILDQSAGNGSGEDIIYSCCDSESLMMDIDEANGQEKKNLTVEDSQDGHSLLRADVVASILKFFAEVCDEVKMRDWLGSPEGSIFWFPLLKLLCLMSSSSFDQFKNSSNRSVLKNASYSELETLTVKFLCKCCWCHPTNQRLLSEVLCKVISKQCQLKHDIPHLRGISGFIRQLFLKLLLEKEKVFVFLTSNCHLVQWYDTWPDSIPNHPQYGAGHNHQLLYISTDTTVEEIRRRISSDTSLAIASFDDLVPILPAFELRLYHSVNPGTSLPGQLKLSQILSLIEDGGGLLSTPCITFTVAKHIRHAAEENTGIQERSDCEDLLTLLATPELSTTIDVFSQFGGLALLAQHLPLGFPDVLHGPNENNTNLNEKAEAEIEDKSRDGSVQDHVCHPLRATGVAVSTSIMSRLSVPPHSLAAFACFLGLPGYAEVLLSNKRRALCLLKLVLGFTDDGSEGDIYNGVVTCTWHTSPFQILRQLFEDTPPTTDDGVLLRRTAIDIGAMHLIFNCISVLTHQSKNSNLPGIYNELITPQQSTTEGEGILCSPDDRSNLYWAKGTGFSTGSTAQFWDVEEALLRQRNEDEHVTVLLQVISSYIHPEDCESESESLSVCHPLPTSFCNLMLHSCLLPALSAYLRNDSVLDMSRHIPLYLAVLELVRAMAVTPQLVPLLLPEQRMRGHGQADDSSLLQLLKRMKDCVNIYAARVKFEESTQSDNSSEADDDLLDQSKQTRNEDKALAVLIAEIQSTTFVVEDATQKLLLENQSLSQTNGSMPCSIEYPVKRSAEEIYSKVMKELQFDTFEMITEIPEGGYQFVVAYHFESDVRSAGERNHPYRMKRLAQEAVTLSTSLPLSYSSSVFVRCDSDRLDIMKVLITGPAETPYANGCFEFDVYFPPDYPNSPMLINFQTTGRRSVRFNPNLYTDGRVCLSVLNTWHGRPEERWNAQTSSFLQVLVSIQSLILVPEPYFNEPGYERSRGSTTANLNSLEYNANIYRSTAKWAMLEQIRNPCPCFHKVINTHFWLKQREILKQLEEWIDVMKNKTNEARTDQAIAFHRLALERHLEDLKREFHRLEPLEGYKDFEESSSEFCLVNVSTAKDSVSSGERTDVGVTSDASQNSNVCCVINSSSNDVDMEKEGECLSSDSETDVKMEEIVSNVCESL
ncbi:baculoviral IAP repeat-containing protein 6 [Anabrus simplex]|uniref:baculoviral IAP repeat-containing protein 6 n=1 Tax=Anabrus simplex TaxID=316456 RepID=UPI0035A2664E